MVKINNQYKEVGYVGTLKKELSSFAGTFEIGDIVKVIGKGNRGYELLHEESGLILVECGWDIFE